MISTCNKCGAQYPSAPVGTIHKCGSCSGGMMVRDDALALTPDPVETGALKVTQADRDAAADYLRDHGYWHIDDAEFHSGAKDETPLVQAFARHHIAHSAVATCKFNICDGSGTFYDKVDGECRCTCHSGEGRSNGAGEELLTAIKRAIPLLEEARSEAIGYHESTSQGPADTQEYDSVLSVFDAALSTIIEAPAQEDQQ